MRKCWVPGFWPKPEPWTTVTCFWRINSNSARSIMAEAITNYKGRPNFTAYSAGEPSLGRGSAGGHRAAGKCSFANRPSPEQEFGRILRA